jgi:hypothetical protein
VFDRKLIRLAGAVVVILLIGAGIAMAALPPGGTFTDDNGNTHEGNIEAIAAEGITKGCNPPNNDLYCPDDVVTRGQMAAFLVRALDLPPYGYADVFDDDDDSTFEADIEALAQAAITWGCNPPANTKYCPDDPVTRGQMAAFLVRALDLPPFGDANVFHDDDGSTFEDDIQALAAAGITKGCNPPDNTEFCPDDPVLRDQMASFLSRALDLTPIIPPPPTTTTTTTTTTSTTSTTTTPPPPPPPPPSSGWDPTTCTFDGIPMWGRVQVVDFFADVTIQEVDFFPDLRVELVDFFPSSCGQWEIVDFFPDFTVQVVDFFPDLRVEYVDFFPGPGP